MSNEPRPQATQRTFYTVQQVAARHPAFTVRTLRHWIYYAHDRPAWKDGRRVLIPGNGFDRVMFKLGSRIYIDEAALFDWLERRRS